MADLRVLHGVKIVDADTPANSVQVDASGNLTAILAVNADVNIGDIGFLAADTDGQFGVKVVEVDLDERELQEWLSVGCDGEWQALYPNERRPSTYGPIGEDVTP